MQTGAASQTKLRLTAPSKKLKPSQKAWRATHARWRLCLHTHNKHKQTRFCMTFSFNKRLSLLALAFVLAQGVLHHSLQSAALNTPFADDVKAHTLSAAHSILSAAVYPLDLMKKASLCVIKSPWIFLTATSALMPQAQASSLLHPIIPPHQQIKEVTFSLSHHWDTETCTGRALNTTHKQNFLHQKKVCRTQTCAPYVHTPCERINIRTLSGHDALSAICDDLTCAPRSVHSSSRQLIEQKIADCTKDLCQQAGQPYTGHFTFLGPKSYIGDSSKTAFIDQHILASEKFRVLLSGLRTRDVHSRAILVAITLWYLTLRRRSLRGALYTRRRARGCTGCLAIIEHHSPQSHQSMQRA